MSIEYVIQSIDIPKNVFSKIIIDMKERFPSAEIANDGDSLWIPSIDPKWIDFSIKLSSSGCFIVSNLNGKENNEIFALIENILRASRIDFNIEEV